MKYGTLTRKGRVVYDREPTPFRWCDVRRIVRALAPPPGRGNQLICYLESVDRILDFLPPEITSETIEIQPAEPLTADFGRILIEQGISQAFSTYDGFGGGDLGGGGASRSVDPAESSSSSPAARSTGNPFAIGPCGVSYIVMPFQGQCLDEEE